MYWGESFPTCVAIAFETAPMMSDSSIFPLYDPAHSPLKSTAALYLMCLASR